MPELPGTRVAIVTPSMRTRGGTEVYLKRLMRLQRELGLTASVYTQDLPSDSAAEPIPDSRFPIIEAGDTISEALSPAKWLARREAVTALADRIAESADWVEFHRIAPIDLMRALRGRVRMLVFVHTPELTCPALGRFLQRSRACCERAPGPGCLGVHARENCMAWPDGTPFPWQQRMRAFSRGPVSRSVAELADAVVFNSRASRHLFLRTLGASTRALILHPPIEAPRPISAVRDANRVLFVGRLEDAKGALDAVRAAALLPGVELHVHGEGSRKEEMAALADKLSVRAVFHGWSSEEKVSRAFAGAGCALMPSVWFEAWGMVGPEAIAAGCPVVAYRNGGIGEWLLPEYGEAVTPGDVNALARAAASQLERIRGGLDTSSWRARVSQRWGPQAFRATYARVLRDAAESGTDVLHIQRKPAADYHSMEVLFDQIREAMPAGTRVRTAVCPQPSRGVVPRLRALWWVKRLRAKVFHVTGDVHFLALALPASRTVLTVHDCNVLRDAGGLRRWLLRKLWFEWPAKRAARVTAISSATRDELVAVSGLDTSSIDVIANCVSPEFCLGPASVASLQARLRVLLVGTAANKNLERALEALRGLPVEVEIIGRVPEALRSRLEALRWSASHDLDVSAMAEAYRRSTLLLFPSLAEGFGMPIVEAQACGTPVVTSAMPPMDEVAGGAALLVDPQDSQSIRAACEQLLGDQALRERLIEQGKKNAARYTPQKTAQGYADVYQSILQSEREA